MIKDICFPSFGKDRSGFLRRLGGAYIFTIISTAVALILSFSFAAHAVSVTSSVISSGNNGGSSGGQGMTVGPNNELWITMGKSFYIVGRGYVPMATPLPADILNVMLGADNAVWFSFGSLDTGGYKIGRATRDGVTNIYPADTWLIFQGPAKEVLYIHNDELKKFNPGGSPETIIPNLMGRADSLCLYGGKPATGPDGALWLVNSREICRINLSTKAVTKYPLSEGWPCSQLCLPPNDFAFGPDGGLWFTRTRVTIDVANSRVSQIGRLDLTAGRIDTWTVEGSPGKITPGPDGAMLFTNELSSGPNADGYFTMRLVIGRITVNGSQSEYARLLEYTSGSCSPGIGLSAIRTGADGNIYAVKGEALVGNGRLNCPPDYVIVTLIALTPDAVAADPSITIVTGGNGRGTVQVRVNRNTSNNQNTVTLTATPAASSQFNGWSEGVCFGSTSSTNRNCEVLLTGARTVTANFAAPVSHQGAVLTTVDKVSVLRLRGITGGLVLVKLIHPETSDVVGQQEVTVPTGGEIQVFMDQLEPATLKDAAGRPSHYTLSMEANQTFDGYFQNVLWDRASGALTNITSCESPVNNMGSIGFVHSSILADVQYNSQIVITNPTDSDVASVSLAVIDATTGTRLGTYTAHTPLKARGSKIITSAELEQGSGVRPDNRFLHYVVKAEGPFTGTIQHLMVNGRAGNVISDLTTACPLNGVAN